MRHSSGIELHNLLLRLVLLYLTTLWVRIGCKKKRQRKPWNFTTNRKLSMCAPHTLTPNSGTAPPLFYKWWLWKHGLDLKQETCEAYHCFCIVYDFICVLNFHSSTTSLIWAPPKIHIFFLSITYQVRKWSSVSHLTLNQNKNASRKNVKHKKDWDSTCAHWLT